MSNPRRLKAAIILTSGTQQAFARDYRIEQSRLSKILHGWIRPRPDELAKLRGALGDAAVSELEQR